MGPASRPTAPKSRLKKIIDQWPVTLIALGLVLTFIWLVALILVPLRLLQMV